MRVLSVRMNVFIVVKKVILFRIFNVLKSVQKINLFSKIIVLISAILHIGFTKKIIFVCKPVQMVLINTRINSVLINAIQISSHKKINVFKIAIIIF